jgi:hypothetical protein
MAENIDAPLVWEQHKWLTRQALSDARVAAVRDRSPSAILLLNEILALRGFAESAMAELPDIAEDDDGCLAGPDHPMSRLFSASWRLFHEAPHPEWEVHRLNPGGGADDG